MTERRRQVLLNLAAFGLLFSVSLYRQLSLRYWPGDPCRTYILYACYVFLIGAWSFSVEVRIKQKSVRRFMLIQAGIILAGVTIRFLQDTYWTDDIPLVRTSGFWLSATLVPLLLFGLYASLGIGKGENYRIPWKWYLLLIPTLLMVFLNVTDESRHFMCYIIPEHPQPNLDFHPYIGTFLMAGFILLLMMMRILYIYSQNHILSNHRLLRAVVPLVEPAMAVVSSFTFFAASTGLLPFMEGKEVLEHYAKMYYSEILTWEFYIYLGLVPVNTEYLEIFEHATIGMQIIKKDGSRILSQNAEMVPDEILEKVEKGERVSIVEGKELHMHRFSEGKLLWNKDVSQLQNAIVRLTQSAEELAEEGALLEEELKTRNQESTLQAKKRIYDGLTSEVRKPLWIMKELTKKRGSDDECDQILLQLYLLGTYVKRRCNLRLIEKETGVIRTEDLQLSFGDMISALNMMGVQAEMKWSLDTLFSVGFSIFLFDAIEQILENERFELDAISLTVDSGQACFFVRKKAAALPEELCAAAKRQNYFFEWKAEENACHIKLKEGGDGCAAEL